MFTKNKLTLALLACLLLLAILAIKVINQTQFFFDTPIWLFLYSTRTNLLNNLMKLVSFLGMYGVIFVSGFILIYLFIKNKKYLALVFMAILGFGEVINVLFKNLVKRPRPIISPLVIEKDFGFPSG